MVAVGAAPEAEETAEAAEAAAVVGEAARGLGPANDATATTRAAPIAGSMRPYHAGLLGADALDVGAHSMIRTDLSELEEGERPERESVRKRRS